MPSPDPKGHALLRQRLDDLTSIVERQPPPFVSRGYWERAGGHHFCVAGTGSSEAHARYLVALLNRYTPETAEFVPLSTFLVGSPSRVAQRNLVVISQGLSPNAKVGMEARRQARSTAVFTATTAAGARQSGQQDRAEFLELMQNEGVLLLHSPMEQEYTTLLRLIGPAACFLTIYRFVATHPHNTLPLLDRTALRNSLRYRFSPEVVDFFKLHHETCARGFYLLASSPLCEYAQNLGYKFLEGLFWSSPVIWDYLQFAHGPFQETSLRPRPVLLLERPNPADAELATRARTMLQNVGVPHFTLQGSCEQPWHILEWECAFNHLVFALIQWLDIDQIQWPSKGQDDPLYGFFRL